MDKEHFPQQSIININILKSSLNFRSLWNWQEHSPTLLIVSFRYQINLELKVDLPPETTPSPEEHSSAVHFPPALHYFGPDSGDNKTILLSNPESFTAWESCTETRRHSLYPIGLTGGGTSHMTWETLTREIRNFNYFRANFACHVPETGGFIELEQSVGWVGDGKRKPANLQDTNRYNLNWVSVPVASRRVLMSVCLSVSRILRNQPPTVIKVISILLTSGA